MKTSPLLLGLTAWLGSGLPLPGAEPDGTFRGVELIPVGSPQSWVVARDFNRDGADDFALLLRSGEGIALFVSLEGGGYARRTIEEALDHPLFATAGFVDGDGFYDLVAGFRQGAQVFHGNGDGTFHTGALLPSIFLGRTVVLARVDADEHTDILLGDEQAGAIRVYLGDGAGGFSHRGDCDGSFQPVRHHAVGRNNRFGATGDFDGDGRVVILQFLFLGGTAPPEPGPATCGPDPTADGLGECRAPCE
jgi:hypothetical protein